MTTDIRNRDCLELRSAGSGDLTQVLELLGRAELPTAGVAEAIAHFVVAESAGKLVGVAGLEVYGASALLRSVAVEEGWRRSGVGRTLIGRALGEARKAGIEDVFLAEVRASVEFQGACPSSAVVMRKSLGEDRP